jgi:two-component system nitrate/nitrite response regulator NarL
VAISTHLQPTVEELPLRILLADDHPSIRRAVRMFLEMNPHFQVIGEAVDGRDAIRLAAKLKPDVVILNVQMPELSGIEAARAIKANLPNVVIVILSLHADRVLVETARKIGARAYVAKMNIGVALVKVIESAVAGGDFIVLD